MAGFTARTSRIEHYTHGQVNPFGLAFDPLGNLFSSDCHSAPIYQLLAGAYYPSFGKPDDGLGFAPTMMEKPRGSTALDGISYYADDLWPEEYRDSLFIGDVMSSAVFRDRAVEQGATKIARPSPDFITTDDPWFRPVDTQLGPDGALYIADFYNRIIGHYEVPLSHPGRDRTSGRIWRVVYRGTNGPPHLRPRRDLSKASAEELVHALADPNLTFRRLATDQLTDRLGQEAVPPVRATLARKPVNPFQTIHCLWVLQRLGALDDKTLGTAAKARDRAIRVHAMRVLADRPRFTPTLQRLALAGLKDPDALVRRCAAEALANHPSYENIQPLLALRRRVPEPDTHLLYVARKALRDQLNVEEDFKRLAASKLSADDAKRIADVALGVKSASAGSFLIEYVQKASAGRETFATILRHAARYAPQSDFDALAQIARKAWISVAPRPAPASKPGAGNSRPNSWRAWATMLSPGSTRHSMAGQTRPTPGSCKNAPPRTTTRIPCSCAACRPEESRSPASCAPSRSPSRPSSPFGWPATTGSRTSPRRKRTPSGFAWPPSPD